MERARPEPQPQQRPLRPAPPLLPVEGTTFWAAAVERPPSPPTLSAAASATLASSCGEAVASGLPPAVRRLLQVKPEQVLLLPQPQARDEEAAASPAQARLLQFRPDLRLLPPPSASEGAPSRPELHPVQPRALHFKAKKQELGPGLDPSVGPRGGVETGPRASRVVKLEGPGPALGYFRGNEKGKLEAEEVMRDAMKGGDGKSPAAIREGVIKTEEPERLLEDCRLDAEPASNGLVHGSAEVILAPTSGAFGPHQQDLRIPLTLHTVPPGARIQFQGAPPSELIRLTKVPLTPVPIKMQSLLEPSVKIETKDVPLTVLPSDAGETSPAIQLPTPAVQRPSPVTLFQPSVSSAAQVAVQDPSLPLYPALPPQRFAGPSQTDTHQLHSEGTHTVKQPTPVSLESTNRISNSASTAHARFATSTIQPPKEYSSVSPCPRSAPIPQASPIPHPHVYQPPPLGHPATLFGTPPRFSFHHPYFLPGPHYFPSSTCPYSRPPFGYGNFPSSMPECLGYYEDRYQKHEAIFSALNRDYSFRDYSSERTHSENSRSCENMNGTSFYNSHSHSGEEYLNPVPQLDIGALENVFTAPTSTPSSIQQVNVTDSDEEEEEKVLRDL
ncbi:transcription factor SOX-30 isoform X3 [Macaca thibetana thibetana]|uniref:transcription factor SOX-30 isoform X3 n=1 Tax=Macaca thibetana thibetana TaxID=257877 RepID=UPI0021BCDC43|nr:transcription factor SOX-30 isoform X3 [Macaca thibetana thibetana]